jgi:protein-tyrosine kinase
MVNSHFSLEHLEKLDMATFAKGAQIVALAAPDHNQGVTTLAKQLAKRSVDMGKSTLLVQFDNHAKDEPSKKAHIWMLGEPLSDKIQLEDDYKHLIIGANYEDILKWSDLDNIERFFTLLRKYFERIILDLPPIIHRDKEEVSPVPLAAKADSLMLVALTARTSSSEAKELVNALTIANVTVAGIILNDRDYPTLGHELARQADKFTNRFPAFAAKLANKARASAFLNVHY